MQQLNSDMAEGSDKTVVTVFNPERFIKGMDIILNATYGMCRYALCFKNHPKAAKKRRVQKKWAKRFGVRFQKPPVYKIIDAVSQQLTVKKL